MKWFRELFDKINPFGNSGGFHESFQKFKMIMCIVTISIIGGDLTIFLIEKSLSPLMMVLTAANLAFLFTLYKPECKKLFDKIFNNDKFDGGSFG